MNMMTAPWHLGALGFEAHPQPHAQTDETPDQDCEPRFLRGLSAERRDKARAAFTEVVLEDGAAVSHQILGAGDLALVATGGLREDLTDPAGDTRLIGVTFAGETFLPSDLHHPATQVHAVGKTTLLVCTAPALDTLLSTIPGLRLAYLEDLQARFSETRRWQVLLGNKTALEKVASMLGWFWQRHGCPAEFGLHLSRRDLGQLTFLTFETVSRQVKALERMGAIALPTPSRVGVLDPQQLLNAAGDACLAPQAA